MGFWLGGDRKVLKPEFLGLKAEVNGAGQGMVPATYHTGRGRSRSRLSSPTHTGDIGLRPAGQGSPGNTLKGPGPENARRSTPGTRLQGPTLETGANRIHHSMAPGNSGHRTEKEEGLDEPARVSAR